ncbi:DUF7007 domain-containing protein [Acinetobacter sp. P1(2025)]|uniref:DUF7007 domain-containing protein n=1 Tax=Acinetobacter sp. P1(2025) TaxID=3446120 RepID=UPI003F53160D
MSWGAVNSEKTLFRGCVSVNCEGHGGILLNENTFKTHPYFAKLQPISNYMELFYEHGKYVFEEDIDASVVYACMPIEVVLELEPHLKEKGAEYWENYFLKVVLDNHPTIFTAITGKEVGVFDSRSLKEQYFTDHPQELFYITDLYDGYNIPDGFSVVVVEKNYPYSQRSERYGTFLIANDLVGKFSLMAIRKATVPFDIAVLDDEAFSEFKVDHTLPNYKPETIEPNAFYSYKSQAIKQGLLVLAYNYTTEQKGIFLFELNAGFTQVTRKQFGEVTLFEKPTSNDYLFLSMPPLYFYERNVEKMVDTLLGATKENPFSWPKAS